MLRYETTSYEVEIPNSLNAFKNWEFSSGSSTGEDFNIFAKLFKSFIKKNIPVNMELITFSKGHYDLFGFIKSNNKFVYFSFSDVRHSPEEWHKNILIRTAKSEKDYTGGSNNYTTLENLFYKIAKLFE